MNLNALILILDFYTQVRFFTTSKALLIYPNLPKDQDKLFKEVDELNQKWHAIDGELEELFEQIREEERGFQVSDSEGETDVK
ncbi:MAG: hypothetical protein EOP34_06645 [Rickettsiales bacterium]|nr:MAG: hypothetical protein EOP34_06645 [Rickettsiales bacterium]